MRIGFSKKVFVFIGIFILGVGIGVGGMVLKERFLPSENTNVVYAGQKSVEIGPLIELGEFLVNLDGGGMLKTEITIEGINGKSEEKIKAKEIFLRDRIISVLGSKGKGDVRSGESREKLKSELITELNDICPDQVKNVLFKSFVYS